MGVVLTSSSPNTSYQPTQAEDASVRYLEAHVRVAERFALDLFTGTKFHNWSHLLR